MIVAGIDEAGLGPLLGPLCLASSAVVVPNANAATVHTPPDLWHLLRDAVSPTRDRTGRRLHVADSKKVFSGRSDAGLESLECGVLAWQAVAGLEVHDTLDALADSVLVRPGDRPRWYDAEADDPQPAWASASNVGIAANVLRHAAREAGVVALPSRARLLFEPEYNHLCDAIRNKAAVVQGALASLLALLLDDHAGADGGLFAVIDRQGGRSHYGPFLRQMFEDWELTVLAESDGQSEYLLRE